MKKLLFIGAIFCCLLLLLSSCDKNSTDSGCKADASGDTVVLVPMQTVPVFTSCSPELKATITKVNDSRCPNGAVCIWGGALSVILQLDNQFSINLDQGKQKDTTYLGHQYSFTLIDGKPFPAVNETVPHDTEISVRMVRH